jgi:hypothetical protein
MPVQFSRKTLQPPSLERQRDRRSSIIVQITLFSWAVDDVCHTCVAKVKSVDSTLKTTVKDACVFNHYEWNVISTRGVQTVYVQYKKVLYVGRAMAQAVSRRPLTTEARVRSQVKSM